MLLILIIFIYFSLTTTSELNENQNIEDNNAENIINIGAKTCNSAYECWSTEPVFEDGRPLFYGIMKRLEINGGLFNNKSGKGKCRCKEGRCMFYSLPTRIFYECQEL